MSRVGKTPIILPSSVTITNNNNLIEVKGKLGVDFYNIPDQVIFRYTDGIINIAPKSKEKKSLMMWGTAQRIISNMVFSVDQGSTVELELNGVGYRASIQGNKLVLQLGYSHDIEYDIPAGIIVKCDKPTSILITGFNKQKVGQMAAEIRSYRSPEPYKGKGIKRKDEFVFRKEGKKK